MNKNILVLFAATLFIFSAYSQDKESAKFHIGPKGSPSLNWYKPDNTQKFKSEGLNFKFSWGIATEFKMAGMAWLSTGFLIERDGGKLSFQDSVFYVVSKDEVLKNKDAANYFNKAGEMIDSTGTNVAYMVKERNYDVRYVTIPLVIKMKTKELAHFTYFFNFGPNVSVKTKARSKDKIIEYSKTTQLDKPDVDISDDMQLFRLQLAIGGGAEYNIFGSTSILMSVNYNMGFSNATRKESRYLYNADFKKMPIAYTPVNQKSAPHNVMLTVGILF